MVAKSSIEGFVVVLDNTSNRHLFQLFEKHLQKQLHIFFYVWPVWCKYFQGMRPVI